MNLGDEMELIYAYIDKYRTFEKQSIYFSNKFMIQYEAIGNRLSITRNQDYFDIYPNNVVGINAIIGKNATGKTSLLSLIGEKIDDRHRNNEIWNEYPENPHKKINIFKPAERKGLEELKYASSYFLLYYYGKNDDNEELFIFETNYPMKFIKVFENYRVLTESNGNFGPPLNYYIGKGWFSSVFKIVDAKNVFLNNTQNYEINGRSPEALSSIIFFKESYYANIFEHALDIDEEYKISIKRRYSSLQNAYLYNQLKFLIGQMNNADRDSTMFRNDNYKINVILTDTYPSDLDSELEFEISDTVTDYTKFALNSFSKEQKIVLAFLNRYTWYLFTTIIFSRGPISDKQRDYITQLKDMQASSDSYEDIKGLYHQQIDLILRSLDSKGLTLAEFLKAEKSLEDFFEKSKGCNVKYAYTKNKLTLEICKDSKLEEIKSFFDYCLDEYTIKNLDKTDSVLHKFLDTNIQWLSDGEKENLSMFTAIHEQISLHIRYKQKYIFLFDEIERSMHPEMCRRLVSDLIRFLGSYPDKEFQIIIASHSPFIAGDIRKENIICLTRDEGHTIALTPEISTFGQNIHTILKTQFFLDCTFGEYSIKVIELIADCLNAQKSENIIEKINKLLDGENQYQEKTFISSSDDAIKYLRTAIASIGEPLIRNELQQRFDDKVRNGFTLEDKIKYYELQIKKLRLEARGSD